MRGGEPMAAPTDRKLPTFMKHAQHPTDASSCRGVAATPVGGRLTAAAQLCLPYGQAPQVSQKYSVFDGPEGYRRLMSRRHTAVGSAKDVCQGEDGLLPSQSAALTALPLGEVARRKP